MAERMAIPNLGNYTLALDAGVRSLGIEPWSSTLTSAEAMTLGIAAAPESLCLPFKAHLGHFLAADDAGCEHALMVNSRGTCRLTYYRTLIENIMRDQGRKIRIWGLGSDGFKPPVIRHFDPGVVPFVKGVWLGLQKIKSIDTLEIAAWETRAREGERGATSLVQRQCLADLSAANNAREVRALHRDFAARFARIERRSDVRPLRVGLVGEVSVLRDRTLNQNTEELLGHLGVEVRNFFLLGAELGNIFGLPIGKGRAHTRKQLAKIAEPWLKNPVGGHALDSVAHTLLCAEAGYDGMVHLAPAGCMPEVSVRPILSAISRSKGIPVLELSFDEHSSPVGVATRLEAFVDILLQRRLRR